MFAKVIPLRRAPLGLPVLDYVIPAELEKKIRQGQLVRAPFRSDEEFALVAEISSRLGILDAKKLRALSAIVIERPLLAQPQLEFLQEMSELYHTSLGFLVKSNLLPLQPRKLAKLKDANSETIRREDNRFVKPVAFWHHSLEEKAAYLKESIPWQGQVLILVPEVSDIKPLAALINSALSDQPVEVSGNLTDKEYFQRWVKIWRGEKRIVVGTRQAIFFPWENLQAIFIDDEGNPNHKSWDMAPRFHSRDAALLLAQRHGARLHLLAFSPSVETFYFKTKNIYQSAGEAALPRLAAAELVNLAEERRGGNYSFISGALEKIITANPAGDIVLFLNRRGSMRYVACRDCGKISTCPNCQRGLTLHSDLNQLKCHFCSYQASLLPRCWECQGVNLTLHGIGTKYLEKELKRLTTRPIIRIDRDNPENIKKLDSAEPKIIIATSFALPHLRWPAIGCLALVDADTPLFIPEYKSAENLWHLLRYAAFRLPGAARFLVQTNHASHAVFSALSEPENFYTGELAERQRFGYPPFKYLARLMCRHASESVASSSAAALERRLEPLTKALAGAIILPSLPMFPPKLRGAYWRVIIIKLSYANYKQALKKILALTPSDWKADPNPNTLLSL